MRSRWVTAVLTVLVLMLVWLAGSAPGQGARYVDRDTLKSWLGDPGVMILDVRLPGDWESSDRKIKGAMHMDPDPSEVEKWGQNLPKDKKIVVYCA